MTEESKPTGVTEHTYPIGGFIGETLGHAAGGLAPFYLICKAAGLTAEDVGRGAIKTADFASRVWNFAGDAYSSAVNIVNGGSNIHDIEKVGLAYAALSAAAMMTYLAKSFHVTDAVMISFELSVRAGGRAGRFLGKKAEGAIRSASASLEKKIAKSISDEQKKRRQDKK